MSPTAWKYAAIAAAALAGYLLYKSRMPSASAPAGAVRADVRGADALELRRLAIGPKAVAEGAKAEVLGPTKAAAREAEKTQIKGG